MSSPAKSDRGIAAHSRYGIVVLRLFLAFVLIYGTQDNVFSQARMREFRDFLAAQKFPVPLVCAYVSVYAQFFCGILIALGWFTRPAAAVMVFNFVVAFVMVHLKLPYDQNIAVLSVLAISVALLLLGAGPWSVDARRAGRRA